MTFTPEFLNDLRQRVPLSEIIGRRIALRKQGRELVALCPFHSEKNPSFTVVEDKGFFHCLAGETAVIVRDGVRSISMLAGTTTEILTRGGKWVRADFKSYGSQRLLRIDLTRNGRPKSLYATSGHRWFVRGVKRDLLTTDLRPGHRLEVVLPARCTNWTLDSDGVRHGIVFGDGSVDRGDYGHVHLHGEKYFALAEWFPDQTPVARKTENGKPYLRIYGGRVFGHMKTLPSLDRSDAYLLGFIAGYLATDGHVANDGTVMLYSAHRAHLQWVRSAATRLGIATYGITTARRMGLGKTESDLHCVHFVPSILSPDLFLKPTARNRFEMSAKKFARLRWVVHKVTETEREEEVYCADVPGEHAFALEDNILTSNCHGCGAHGDVIAFVMRMDNLSFPEAVKYLNGEREPGPEAQAKPNPPPVRPKLDPVSGEAQLAALIEWFAKRGISAEIIGRNSVAPVKIFMPRQGREVWSVAFPYFRAGELINVKYRDGRKNFRQEKGAEKIFYGLDNLGDAQEIVIVEGEVDLLSCNEAGLWNVLSVPDGAPGRVRDEPVDPERDTKFAYLWNCRAYIDKAEKVILATDADGPGEALAEELARRIGKEKCWKVTWPTAGDAPCKDANEVLMVHGAEALRECIEQAEPYPITGLYPAHAFKDAMLAVYRDGYEQTYSTGWEEVDRYFRVRLGDFTVVTGMYSAGKSEWLDALLVNLAQIFDWPFAICSFENLPGEEHLPKLAEKYLNMPFERGLNERMSEDQILQALKWIDQHFVFIRAGDEVPTIDWVLEKARAAVVRFGIKGLVIDPYNEIEHKRPSGMSETEYISLLLAKIKRFAQNHAVHVWFVAHPAKPKRDANGKYPVPTLYDISGCYSDDTEVLTKRGWLQHCEITKDDEVACFDPENSTMTYARPSRIIRKEYAGEMHHFAGCGYDLLVTPEHRMVLEPRWREPVGSQVKTGIGRPIRWVKGRWSFCAASEMPSAPFSLPLCASLSDKSDPGISENLARLAGWYVSEGCAMSSGVSISQAEGRKADQIEALLVALAIPFSVGRSRPGGKGGTLPIKAFYIGVRGARTMVRWLRESAGERGAQMGIPAEILGGPATVKMAFLEAYLAGDGSERGKGSFCAVTTSMLLRDQLQRLTLELGLPCSWHERTPVSDRHAVSWQVNIGRKSRTKTSIRTYRNRTIERYDGLVWCLTVPTGAYFVRRNGKATVGSNSASWAHKADLGIVIHRDRTPGNDEVEIHIKKVRFKAVGREGVARLRYDRATGTYHDPKD